MDSQKKTFKLDVNKADRLYYSLVSDVGMVRRHLSHFDIYSSDTTLEDFSILCCNFEKSVYEILKFIKSNIHSDEVTNA